MIGSSFLIVSGFKNGYKEVTLETYALDTTSTTATWQRMDDLPVAGGITHSAHVVIGTKFYMCGGYVGSNPGSHIDNCLIFDKSKAPGTGQWSSFAPLPSARAGGGLVFDSSLNALFFSGGARRDSGWESDKDYSNTWMYSFNKPSEGWIPKAPLPYLANHLSYTTANKDATGKERHYFFGGQTAHNEANGNKSDLFEYDAANDVWIKRTSLPIPRGHASSSTRAIGCGFIVAGGCINGGNKITDVSYYDVPTDTWTKIGDLTDAINTPVCDISTSGVLYCESGYAMGSYSKKRPIIV